MKPRIPAKIVEVDGIYKADISDYHKRNLQNLMRSLEGKEVWISIEKQTKSRTIPQNSYLWGVVYKTISDETGMDDESVHHSMKDMFLKEHGDGPIQKVRSTKSLTTVEFNDYVEKIVQWAAQFLSLFIPLPNEEAMWGTITR